MLSQQLIPVIDPDSFIISFIYRLSLFPKDSDLIRIGCNFIDQFNAAGVRISFLQAPHIRSDKIKRQSFPVFSASVLEILR